MPCACTRGERHAAVELDGSHGGRKQCVTLHRAEGRLKRRQVLRRQGQLDLEIGIMADIRICEIVMETGQAHAAAPQYL